MARSSRSGERDIRRCAHRPARGFDLREFRFHAGVAEGEPCGRVVRCRRRRRTERLGCRGRRTGQSQRMTQRRQQPGVRGRYRESGAAMLRGGSESPSRSARRAQAEGGRRMSGRFGERLLVCRACGSRIIRAFRESRRWRAGSARCAMRDACAARNARSSIACAEPSSPAACSNSAIFSSAPGCSGTCGQHLFVEAPRRGPLAALLQCYRLLEQIADRHVILPTTIYVALARGWRPLSRRECARARAGRARTRPGFGPWLTYRRNRPCGSKMYVPVE